MIIAVTHFAIDFLRTKIDNRFSENRIHFVTFILDQIIHISVIIITYYALNVDTKVNSLFNRCAGFSNFNQVVLYILLFMVLLDPTTVFVKKIYSYLFDEETQEGSRNNAGATIGKLERIITSILILNNQYGVIGLVLTAKSIARFKQLEDQEFAEKYLIGTLLSILISLIVTTMVKYVLTL